MEEIRCEPPPFLFLVPLDWLQKMQSFLYWSQTTDPTADEASFQQVVTAKHLHAGHPGPVDNKSLLKPFDKYVRVDTAEVLEPEDLVCSKKIVED